MKEQVRKRQRGKIRFGTVLIIVLIVYGAFVAVKIISATLANGQIKNEIIDKIGINRGTRFTTEKIDKIILDILIAHKVVSPDEEVEPEDAQVDGTEREGLEYEDLVNAPRIDVQINKQKALITFFVAYAIEIDLILFKQKKVFEIEDEMRTFN